ncbi:hypothetical protein [Streptomyces sp. AM6-12]|uniref:hypothetical protein n=1 Tax=Streptomyces sp. AM6-12 TaxID=3345149 RepID=UPI00379496FD
MFWDIEGALADALAERLPDHGDLRPQVLARVCVAAAQIRRGGEPQTTRPLTA